MSFQDLSKRGVIEALGSFSQDIGQLSPCLYRGKDGRVCGITKRVHTTGHYGQKVGEHDGLSPPPDILLKVINHIKKLKDSVDSFFFHFVLF
jgi:hypothetical protein